MMALRLLSLLFFLGALSTGVLPGVAQAAVERLHLVVGAVQNADGSERGDATAELARRLLRKELQGHPEVSLEDTRLRGIQVTLRLLKVERTTQPPLPGKRFAVLEQRVRLSMVGTTLPEAQLMLGGDGESTVQAEVGAHVTPRQQEDLLRDALQDAISQAVTQALREIKSGRRK